MKPCKRHRIMVMAVCPENGPARAWAQCKRCTLHYDLDAQFVPLDDRSAALIREATRK